MRSPFVFLFATGFVLLLGNDEMRAMPSPAERVDQIQKALQAAKIDGWLFYDFRGSDPLALRILRLDEHAVGSRRWFYYVPASGECTKLVHRIEPAKLDPIPGKRQEYSSWKEQHALLQATLTASNKKPRIAMQYSPMNDVPYMSKVDAGTVELIRSLGVEVVTSAELVQQFEAIWTPEQLQSHIEASDKMHRIILDAFAEIARRVKADEPTTEYDIQRFIVKRWHEEGMGSDDDDPIVAVNENTANPHYTPKKEGSLPIKRGDFVLLDLASKLRKPGAVFTDQTWTGYVGETVPEAYNRVFKIVREARDAAVEFVRTNIREGKPIRGADVDDVSRGVITKAGYAEKFTHRTGHSIGEEVHGNGVNIDNFETRDSRRITPGVCFSIEPGIYLKGNFGVRSEIDVYVLDKDIEITGQPIQTEVVAILKSP
ncbi:MAG TPA: M24 family metallopeptidase [Chthoniobacterales bacterium]|nr:M24 family metallopeptidase [Chthoniobacterales bacterium]